MSIPYQRLDHAPVFTCEQAAQMVPDHDAGETKNLFIKDKKGRRHFLVSVDYGKSVDLKALGRQLGMAGLSLASPERLKQHLNVAPGSVTLLSVINDEQGQVEVILDQDLMCHQALACHPLVNTATLLIPLSHLLRFLEETGHKPKVMDIPARK